MKTPETIVNRAPDYKDRAWEQYTLQELGNWVHNFVKRAGHRTDKAKAEKDLTDASNYLDMMRSHIEDARERLT